MNVHTRILENVPPTYTFKARKAPGTVGKTLSLSKLSSK